MPKSRLAAERNSLDGEPSPRPSFRAALVGGAGGFESLTLERSTDDALLAVVFGGRFLLAFLVNRRRLLTSMLGSPSWRSLEALRFFTEGDRWIVAGWLLRVMLACPMSPLSQELRQSYQGDACLGRAAQPARRTPHRRALRKKIDLHLNISGGLLIRCISLTGQNVAGKKFNDLGRWGEEMMRGLMICILAFMSTLSMSCEPGTLSPGSITARWTLSPQNCEALHLVTLEARAVREGEVVVSQEVACADSGEILLDGLDPAFYTVEIEGFNDEDPPRGTHMDSEEGLSVLEGEHIQTMELRLVEKTARVHVRWKFTDGLPCVDNQVTKVSVGLYVDDVTNHELVQKVVECSVLFTDPLDGLEKSGLLFEDLVAQNVILVIDGYDKDNTKTHEGSISNIELFPGDTKDATITLEAVPLGS